LVVETACRASAKCRGNCRPRFSALLSIPAAALEERKKRGGTSGSKMSDNEHSAASLGNSEESRVQHSPGHAIPELGQRRENDGEISSAVGRQESGNVLNEEPAGLKSVCDSCELEEEAGVGSVESGSLAGDGQVLAGEPSAKEVNTIGYPWPGFPPPVVSCLAYGVNRTSPRWFSDTNSAHVLVAGDIGPVGSQHTPSIDALRPLPPLLVGAVGITASLALPHNAHTGTLQSEVDASDAREERPDIQDLTPEPWYATVPP
jgi:hypothetical protein